MCTTRLLKSESRRAQVLRFIIAGGIATVLQYGCYIVLLSTCSIPSPVASMASYVISMACNFFMSSIFTFRTRPTIYQVASFAASHIVNFVLQTVLVAAFTHVMPPEWALLPAMVICVPINFVLVRLSLTAKSLK